MQEITQLFATALQILHFKNFLEEFGPISQTLRTWMGELKRCPCPAMFEVIEGSQDYKYLMESYEHSIQQTLHVDHGNTFPVLDDIHHSGESISDAQPCLQDQ